MWEQKEYKKIDDEEYLGQKRDNRTTKGNDKTDLNKRTIFDGLNRDIFHLVPNLSPFTPPLNTISGKKITRRTTGARGCEL